MLTALCSCRKSGITFVLGEHSGSEAKQNPFGIYAVSIAFVIVGSGGIWGVGWVFCYWGGVFFGFMVHWIKELCNLLSNVQFIHIFHLLKLYLLSSIQQVPTICSLSNRNIPVSPPLLSVCQRYKSFQNSSSSSPENLFMWYNNYKNKYIANDGLNSVFFFILRRQKFSFHHAQGIQNNHSNQESVQITLNIAI